MLIIDCWPPPLHVHRAYKHEVKSKDLGLVSYHTAYLDLFLYVMSTCTLQNSHVHVRVCQLNSYMHMLLILDKCITNRFDKFTNMYLH